MYNNNNSRAGNPYKPNNSNSPSSSIRLEFLEKGFRENGVLREALILKEAKEIAEALYNQGNGGLSNSQLRAFFNEIKALQNRINKSEELFEKNYPFILMLKSKAAYKYRNGVKNAPITENFYKFINAGVDYIKQNKNLQTFEDFVLLFEVVVGYFYGLGGSK